MRPPEFTGGNAARSGQRESRWPRFNEAAGIHRRKHRKRGGLPYGTVRASMRPPEFTGGNADKAEASDDAEDAQVASMRPPEFTGGNLGAAVPLLDRRHVASMRPPEFTGGNPVNRSRECVIQRRASMRPPEFTGGNNQNTRGIIN